ncbi:ABC transporter ATP-binding protein [Mameliella alba]|nr:ABC transporter ATP-binding protein [Mameliella alba]MBY6171257.1 ABC transporter ATP-binding protein [Mameliella alba]MBY6176481.1 ABC transporter ATP-binding protein [Mameliella alba]
MLLHVKGVTKTFAGAEGPVPVLAGVDLRLDMGQTMSLQGESGSGKSTLLHIVGGLDTVDSGQVLFDGRDIATLDEAGRAALRRSDVAVIFQQFNLIPSLDVWDNIRFQARLSGRADAGQAEQLLRAMGLASHRHKYPEQLSGGQQQRVAIARALAARPRLILADEPTGNLDEATAGEVLEEMLALVGETGAGLMVVTHSPAVATRMDRQLHLAGGRLV